jgi:iron(III) transport system ATP-binding protein
VKDIRVVGLAKAFGRTPAVDHVGFDVPAGWLATLLGPSGCGKTTTLRLLAGLEKPDAGEVHVGGRLLTSAPRAVFVAPEKRRMGMVFQTYAIWPHMTVFENIAFPLREKRVPAAEVRERVMAALRMLGLEGFHDRPAPLLSGGQQQRVALGRALVANPDVLLLDEPFSNLDARLREEMRLELKELQARVGVTTVFVTHDQAEAMILSDRVFVMSAGRIAQQCVGPSSRARSWA